MLNVFTFPPFFFSFFNIYFSVLQSKYHLRCLRIGNIIKIIISKDEINVSHSYFFQFLTAFQNFYFKPRGLASGLWGPAITKLHCKITPSMKIEGFYDSCVEGHLLTGIRHLRNFWSPPPFWENCISRFSFGTVIVKE